MRRRLKILLVTLAALGFAAVSLPWWVGLAARPVVRHWGVDLGTYERVGYARFRLTNASYRRAGLRVEAGRIETDTPLLWGWRHVFNQGSHTTVEHWSVVVSQTAAAPAASPRGGQSGATPLQAHLDRLAPGLERWLPHVTLQGGIVRWPGGGLQLAQAKWEARTLQFQGLAWRAGSTDGKISFGSDQTISIEADQPDDFHARLRWAGPTVEGELSVWSQKLELRARFANQGWLPVEASGVATTILIIQQK